MRLAALIAVSLSAVALAETANEAQRYIDAAATLYGALNYEAALEQLGRAKQCQRTLPQDVEIALYQGLIWAETGQDEKSRDAFLTALSLAPDSKLPVRVSPKIREQFEQLRLHLHHERVSAPVPPPPPAPAPAPVVVVREAPPVEAAPTRWPVWVSLGAAGALAVGSGACFAQSGSLYGKLQTGTQLPYATWNGAVQDGKTFQTAGVVLSAAAGAALVAAGTFWLIAPSATPQGAGLAVAGRFP